MVKIEREKILKRMKEENDLENSIMNSSIDSAKYEVIVTEPKNK